MYLSAQLLSLIILGSIPLNSFTPALAQSIPDQTLGREGSVVTSDQFIKGIDSDLVSGGAKRNASLFHSFKDFNVNLGRGVYFSNPEGINNILVRVTSSNSSNISGVLGVLGSADLFIANPNGIVFREGAKLDLNGSFLATTADAVNLPKGEAFSAKNPQPVPLLTIGVPIGLTFSGSSGKIEIQGPGHHLIGNSFEPIISNSPSPEGLKVNPGSTLALVGGDVTLVNGIVTAPSGRVEIGSVNSGSVKINPSLKGFSLAYDNAQGFNNLHMSRASLVDISGFGTSNVQIYGKDITITDTSLIRATNLGLGAGGNIAINAANSFTSSRLTPFAPPILDPQPAAGIVSETFSGTGANININAKQLTVQDAGLIGSFTFGTGMGGNITLNELGNNSSIVRLQQLFFPNPLPDNIAFTSAITTATVGQGQAGNILLNAQHLSIQDGNQVSSIVFGSGNGGDVTVNASESVNVAGYIPRVLSSSLLSSITLGLGNAGNLVIKTKQLNIQDGGRVDSSTLSFGDSGSIEINASDSINISGNIPGSINPSLIISSANEVDPIIRETIGLPALPSGSSGSVVIRGTGQLNISDGAQVTVRNDSENDAGSLSIRANSIRLNNQGGITASTAGGNGGNIELDVKDQLLLRNGSTITASAEKLGDGGNITFNPGLVILLEGSRISADAEKGTGGRVNLTAQGLFRSTDSSITATSALGPQFNGIVRINAPDTDLDRATALPVGAPNPPKVSSVCQGRAGAEPSQYVRAGKGGIPKRPSDLKESNPGWGRSTSQAKEPVPLAEDEDDLTPIQGWVLHPDGTMNFTTQPGVFYSPPVSSCSQMKTSM